MKWSLILASVLVSCAHKSVHEEPKITPVVISSTEIEACVEYQAKVLDKSFTETEKDIKFTRSQKEARWSLSQFDVAKGLAKPKSQAVQNILTTCNEELIKQFDQHFGRSTRCSIMFSEVKYFQALAVAIKSYPWPTDLKLEGKKVALDYVRYYADGHYPLINRLIAMSVLDELSVNKIVNEKLHAEIKATMNEAQGFVEGLRGKLGNDESLTCQSLSIVREELEYGDKIGTKLNELLGKI